MAKTTPHKIIYVRAANDIAEKLEELAEEENRSVSNMAEVILRRYLEGVGKLPKEKPAPQVINESLQPV